MKTAIVPVIAANERERPTLSTFVAAISAAVRFRPSIALLVEEESYARAFDCGADEGCVASELVVAGVDLGILVVVNTEIVPALLAVKLIDARNKKTIAESVTQLDASRIAGELGARASELFERSGHPLAAQLRVKIDPAPAMVTIDGVAPGVGVGGVYMVTPGKHVVSASYEDHVAQSIELEAKAGTESEVSLVLVREPAVIESPWLWIGVAVALAGAATALVIATRSTERYVCGPFDGVDCVPN